MCLHMCLGHFWLAVELCTQILEAYVRVTFLICPWRPEIQYMVPSGLCFMLKALGGRSASGITSPKPASKISSVAT